MGCPGCGAFGTMVAEAPVPRAGAKGLARPPLRLVDVVAEEAERITTGVPDLPSNPFPGGGRHWVAGDMSFWLVSDLEMTELAALEALLRKPG